MANTIKIGTVGADAIMMGTSSVTKVYVGSEQVYPSGTPPHDYSQDYLTVSVVSAGTLTFHNSILYYSIDGGDNWIRMNNNTINVNVGDKVLLKGNVSSFNNISLLSGSTAYFDLEGNVMSITYNDSFIGQTTLTSSDGYARLFQQTNVVNANNLILPATTLASGCYSHFFENCPYLITAPELPATTMPRWVYSEMFRDCVSLIKAPDLPAAGFTSYSYNQMFQGCSSLNYIKCLATSFGGKNNWVLGVSSTGTFVKHPNANWTTGNSGIPNGWTVINDGQ